MSGDTVNAAAGLQQAMGAMDLARRALTAMEEDYAYWMAQYKRQAREAGEWTATTRDEEATRPSPLLRALEDTKHGLDCASQSLSEARREVASAREELNNARQFFMHLTRTAAPSRGDDRERSHGNERAAVAMRRRELIPGTTMPNATPVSASASMSTSQEAPPSAALPHSSGISASAVTSTVHDATPATSGGFQTNESGLHPPDPQGTPPVKRQRSETLRMSMPAQRTRYARNFLWERDGEMHHFPEDFEIPHCPLSHAWELWCCGDAKKMYPPFRILLTRDLANRTLKKLYSEYRFAMIWIEEEVRQRGAWSNEDYPSFEAVTDMLDRVKADISDMRNNSTRNKQPIECLQWTTATSLLRKRSKLAKQANVAPQA